MNSRVSTIFLCLGVLTILPVSSRHAFATLGEGAESIAKDCIALSAVKRATTSRANYQIQEVASEATVVREFITPSGVVFAVAWNGYLHPDLNALRGGYADDYQSAKQQLSRKRGQKRIQVKTEQLVVETWGHMRNLQGRAYLPALVPAGVNVDEIH